MPTVYRSDLNLVGKPCSPRDGMPASPGGCNYGHFDSSGNTFSWGRTDVSLTEVKRERLLFLLSL